MLDIIEIDLFKKHLPTVTYLRLDGSVPPNNRHSIVTKFNGDPSIDVLLLTTQVHIKIALCGKRKIYYYKLSFRLEA